MQEFTANDTLLSGSPDKAMATMLGVMIGLKDIYAKETDAIKSRDINRFLTIQPVKEAYTRDYETLVKEIQARAPTIKKMSSPLRDRLVAEQHELSALAEESMEWSMRMADSLSRVQDRLMNAARQAMQSDKPVYGARGGFDMSGRPVASAYNQAC